MPPKNSVEFNPELLYVHDTGTPLQTLNPIGKVNESRLDGLDCNCMIVVDGLHDEALRYADIDTALTKRLVYKVSYNGNFEKGEVIKAMHNNDILVKVGNKFYTPTNIEYEVSLCGPTDVKIDATLAPYLEVTAKERTNPLAIKDVIFNDPATIVLWQDGTKTVVKANHGDTFDPEKGLAMAITKKALGNKGKYFDILKKYLKK